MKKIILAIKYLVLFMFIVCNYSCRKENNNDNNPTVQTPGSLDLTFGGTGFAVTNIAGIGTSVIIQPDGKIVVAGYYYNEDSENDEIVVIRYNTNGTFDNSFGANGRVITAIGNNNAAAWGIVLQNDGKIVVAGSYDEISGIVIVRYNSNGTLDNTFGNAGIVTDTYGDIATSVSVQSDGKIVIASVTPNSNFLVARYNTNGILDNTFGTGGKVVTPIGNGNEDAALAIKVQSDGKIIAAGYSTFNSITNFTVVRYNSNGTLDNTFGTGGISLNTIGSSGGAAFSLAIQTDGKIVGSGVSLNNEDIILRYNANGVVDSAFGTNGMIKTTFGTGYTVAGDIPSWSVVIQSDGKIVAGGGILNGSSGNFAVARYTGTGNIDANFGLNGKTVASGGLGYSIDLQSDGKIVIAGTTSDGYITVARFIGS